MKLRTYQQDGINLLKQSMAKGNKKILLNLATGGGKSIIIKVIFEMALNKNQNAKLLYVVHRNILIGQMKETLKDLNVDVMTLQKAGRTETDVYDLVLSDETHFGHGSKLFSNINYRYFIGLTATGIKSNGTKLDGFDDVIDVAQLKDLIDLGFMPPLKVYSTPKVETKGLKVTGGDFNNKASFDLMSKSEVVKDIVKVYENNAKGLKTLIYCVNIEHSEMVAKQFRLNGYKCESYHSKTPNRDELFNKYKNNEIDILTNCDTLTTGVDLPDIYCLILAAPTKSFIKATQIFGRIRLNPNDINKVGLILDVAQVVHNTQHPYDRLNIFKTKEDKNLKKCTCGETMTLVNRDTKILNDFEYLVISKYKCKCGLTDTVENIKLFDEKQCEQCGEIIKGTPIQNKDTDKSMKFVQICQCGCENVVREILYSDKELKVIQHKENLNSDNDWVKIKAILKDEAKKWNYKHQWVGRAMEILRNKDSKLVLDKIAYLQANNKKIGSIVYL